MKLQKIAYCRKCNKKFKTKSSHKKYCSFKCTVHGRRNKCNKKITCKKCNKNFKRKLPSSRKYCYKCEKIKNVKYGKCKSCKKRFIISKKNRIYCSKKCNPQNNNKTIIRIKKYIRHIKSKIKKTNNEIIVIHKKCKKQLNKIISSLKINKNYCYCRKCNKKYIRLKKYIRHCNKCYTLRNKRGKKIRCKGCNKQFISIQNKVYCSDKCKPYHEPMNKILICKTCNKEFIRINMTQKYCSAKCKRSNPEIVATKIISNGIRLILEDHIN